MNIASISDEIFRELDQPTNLSVPQISFWLISNIGQLNILIEQEYVVLDNEFSPELGDQEKDIFKQLYFVKYYSSLMTSNLGAAAYDWSELSEGDSTIRRVSKNEVAKNYKQLRDSYYAGLQELVFFYKKNQIRPEAYQLDSALYDEFNF